MTWHGMALACHGILHLILETHPKLNWCSRSYRPCSRQPQNYESKHQNSPTRIRDLVQGLRTNFIPNADGKQRIQTETSSKYYADHVELWYDSEEKDKSTAGSFEFKALVENTVYQWLYNLSWQLLFLWKQRNQSEMFTGQGRTDKIIKDVLLSACPDKVVLTGELLTLFPQELRTALSHRTHRMLWCSCFSLSALQEKQWPRVAYTSYNSARNIKENQ